MKQCETNRIQYPTRGVQVTCCITRCPTVFLSRPNMVLLRVISNSSTRKFQVTESSSNIRWSQVFFVAFFMAFCSRFKILTISFALPLESVLNRHNTSFSFPFPLSSKYLTQNTQARVGSQITPLRSGSIKNGVRPMLKLAQTFPASLLILHCASMLLVS